MAIRAICGFKNLLEKHPLLCSVSRVVINDPGCARLLRRREERERCTERHVIGVHIVTGSQSLIGDEVEQGIDGVIARTASIGEAGIAGSCYLLSCPHT